MNQKQMISIPLSIDEIMFLKANSERKSFLLDYGDQINGELLIPKLFIEFPPELKHMADLLKRKLSLLKEKEKDKFRSEEKLSKSNKSTEKYSVTDKKRKKSKEKSESESSDPKKKIKKPPFLSKSKQNKSS